MSESHAIKSPGLRALYDEFIGDDPERVASFEQTLAREREQALLPTLEEIERQAIVERMELFDGCKQDVADSLGISLKTLYTHMHQYGLSHLIDGKRTA